MNLSGVLVLVGAVVLGAVLMLVQEMVTRASDREDARRKDARALRNAKRARLAAAYRRLVRVMLEAQSLQDHGTEDGLSALGLAGTGRGTAHFAADFRRDVAVVKLAVLLEDADSSVEGAFARIEATLDRILEHGGDSQVSDMPGIPERQRQRISAGFEQLGVEVDRLVDVARAQLVAYEQPI
jgi:hypothetical protein